MATLNVNTDELIKYTAKLEKLHRSAFPSAVRNTLNSAAFDMKQKEFKKSFKKEFKPKTGTMNYLNKVTRVEKAVGFNIKSMESIMYLDPSNKKDRRFVDGLEKQEKGGIVDDGFRYLKAARGNRIRGRVALENQYDKNKVISSRSKRKGTRKSKFVARAYRAFKEDKPMFFNTMKGNFLVKVKTMSQSMKTRKLNIKFAFLAMHRKDDPTKLKRTDFVRNAASETTKKMESFYVKNAEFQFKKHLS